MAIAQRLAVPTRCLERLIADRGQHDLRILEVGCGFNADNLRFLAARFPDASFTGLDFRINRDLPVRGRLAIIEDDLERWQPTGVYDCVLSLAVLEHLVDPQGHLRLIERCLAKDGVAVLTTPTPLAHAVLLLLTRLGIFDRAECDDHKLYLTRRGIQRLGENAALSVMDFHYFQIGLNQWCVLAKQALGKRGEVDVGSSSSYADGQGLKELEFNRD